MTDDGASPEVHDGLPLPRRRLAYFAIALSITMAVLDGTIANTALPQIARDLRASPSSAIWIVNGFQLAVTASLLTFAALGQRRGPVRVYRYGVIVFIAGSLASALAHTLPLLVAARVLQGFGASAIMAITPAILREVFPRAQLGRALGINALVVATSTAAGPTLGGLMLAVAPWPLIFAINVPFGLANVALNRALPDDPVAGSGRIELASVAASAVGFASLIWGLDGFAHAEPGWSIALRLAVGLGAFGWFVRRQLTAAEPMIALDLFRLPSFALAGATSWGTFCAQGLAFVALPFYFQESLGRTALASGLLLTAWPLAIAVVAPFAGRLSDRYPAAILSTAGLAVFALGLALYAALPAHATTLDIAWRGVVAGVGFGFFQSPNNREMFASVPRAKSASASGLLATFRVSAQTVGAALVAIVFGALGVRGASAAGGAGAAIAAEVARAVPVVLWIACGFALAAAGASGLRLRARTPASDAAR